MCFLISKQDAKTFELKINMTDTEIVVVENDTSVETAAVILKVSAVLSFLRREKNSVKIYLLKSLHSIQCTYIVPMEHKSFEGNY